MYLTALIEELRKNPERYEGKEYKQIYTSLVVYKIKDGKLHRKNPALEKKLDIIWAVDINEQVEEIPQEITMELAELAYNAGRTVQCLTEKGAYNFIPGRCKIWMSIEDIAAIQNGKWYIKEES